VHGDTKTIIDIPSSFFNRGNLVSTCCLQSPSASCFSCKGLPINIKQATITMYLLMLGEFSLKTFWQNKFDELQHKTLKRLYLYNAFTVNKIEAPIATALQWLVLFWQFEPDSPNFLFIKVSQHMAVICYLICMWNYQTRYFSMLVKRISILHNIFYEQICVCYNSKIL